MKEYLKKNKLSTIIILLFVGLLVLAMLKNSLPKSTNQAATRPVPTQPVQSIIYNDPDNYLTINIPSNWNSSTEYGSEKKGINSAQKTITKLELINLASPDKAGISVLVYENKPSCTNFKKPNSTLGGLPAFYDPKHAMWVINTIDATYDITYYYPGAGLIHRPYRITPTPVPQFQTDAYQRLINSIISTIHPKTLQVLTCE